MAMPTRPRETVPTKANVKVGDERYNDGQDRVDAVKERLRKKLETKPAAKEKEIFHLKVHFKWGEKKTEHIKFHFDDNPKDVTLNMVHDGVCEVNDKIDLSPEQMAVSLQCASFYNSKQEQLDGSKSVEQSGLKCGDVLGILVEKHVIHGHIVMDVETEEAPKPKFQPDSKHGMIPPEKASK